MSRRTGFEANLRSVAAKMGGAHLTRETRNRTVRKFAALMQIQGFTHLRSPADICGKHLRAFVAARQREEVNIRTLQNELAHLRGLLRFGGRPAVAVAPELSNKALSVSGGKRVGTKRAMTDEELASLCKLAQHQNRPGMAALILLERYLGLRGAEAIFARDDTLARWLEEVGRDQRFEVVRGTKGGRRRVVKVMSLERALDAIRSALSLAQLQGGFLVTRADGRPAGGLKEARSIYHSWAHRAGVLPHSARYAFAQDQFSGYVSRHGYSPREALAAVSLDLGHGDGRGRWVKSVYMK